MISVYNIIPDNEQENFFLKLYDYAVIEKPVIALSFMFLITILLSIGLKDFKLDASADSLTLERDADLEFHRQVSTRYGTDNFLVVTFLSLIHI